MFKKTLHFYLILSALVMFSFWGFKSGSNDPRTSKTTTHSTEQDVRHTAPVTPNTIMFSDNFNAANDTTSLKARGYKVWYRGTGPQGLSATWYQGVDVAGGGPFNSYEGATTGYVAANYNVVTGTNTIDNWLVLPFVSGGLVAGDSLSFWSRSPDASIYPDSLWVCYSAAGDSIPEGSWTVLGRFKVSTAGWQQKAYVVPTTSATGRICIRYHVTQGGPSGANSDYIGIDALVLSRGTVGITPTSSQVPSSYSLEQNYPNPFNPSTKFNFALPKAGNVKLAVYDVLGNEVEVISNGYRAAGTYSEDFDASKLSSGVYFYRLEAGDFTKTMKMTLIK